MFAAAFLAATVWFWRRSSAWAVVALLALCAFEAGVAPTLNAETVTKSFDVALGTVGVVAGLCVLGGRRLATRALPAPGRPPVAHRGSARPGPRGARS